MVTQSQYLNTISKTRTVLRKKGFWTRADEEYFQNLEKLIATNNELWDALRLLVDKYSLHKNGLILKKKSLTSMRILAKTSKSFSDDARKFSIKYGAMLLQNGFENGIDSFGYPGMKSIADFKVVFNCMKCNREWESRAVVKELIETKKLTSTPFQYKCPDCGLTNNRRKLVLQTNIYPETRQEDIIKILKEL